MNIFFAKWNSFFFNTEISFSQGKFLLADCEVLACAAGGRDKGASELTRCVRGCGSVMPASKLAAQHSPCTLLRRLPSRDNSSKIVKLLRLMGSPFSLHPIPRHAWRWGILGSGVELDIVPWREGETRLSVIGYQLLVFSCQLSVSTLNPQPSTLNPQLPTPNFQLSTNH